MHAFLHASLISLKGGWMGYQQLIINILSQTMTHHIILYYKNFALGKLHVIIIVHSCQCVSTLLKRFCVCIQKELRSALRQVRHIGENNNDVIINQSI